MSHPLRLAVLVLSVVVRCNCETFHVVPVNSTERYEVEPCYTLDQIANEIMTTKIDDLTLNFLPGKHYLYQQLGIYNVKNVKLIGSSLGSEIQFQQNSMTMKVQDLVLESLTFVSSNYTDLPGKVQIDHNNKLVMRKCTLKQTVVIVTTENMTTTECTFANYYTTQSVIEVYSNYVQIKDCKFVDNVMIGGFGATLAVRGHLIYITHCTFTNNYGGLFGGSIRIVEDDNLVYITDSEFRGNHAIGDGGAISVGRRAARIYIQNTSFAKNNARDGGAISIEYSNSTEIINCTFMENTATDSVVYVSTSYLHILNCRFADHKSNKSTTIKIEVLSQAFIIDSTVVNNYGTEGGGIRLVEEVNWPLHIQRNALLYITNCNFIGNKAKLYGGAIYIKPTARISIAASTFSNNTAEQGGAIQLLDYKYLKIISCIFLQNYASYERSAGAISTEMVIRAPRSPTLGAIHIRDTNFVNNSGSGALTIFQTSASIENTSFTYNENNRNNYVLAILQSTLTMTHTTFEQNKGYIYLFDSRVDITGPVTLSGNTGGGIRAIQSKIYVNNTNIREGILITLIISSNKASSGGGIMLRESELIVISPIVVSRNKAQMFGGGIYAYKSVIDFTHKRGPRESFIIDNFAGQNGGGVHAIASTFKLTKTSYVTIGSNIALHSGGGLFLQENSQIYLIKKIPKTGEIFYSDQVRLEVTNNSATYGGGIYIADNSTAGAPQCKGKTSLQVEDGSFHVKSTQKIDDPFRFPRNLVCR